MACNAGVGTGAGREWQIDSYPYGNDRSTKAGAPDPEPYGNGRSTVTVWGLKGTQTPDNAALRLATMPLNTYLPLPAPKTPYPEP